MPRLTTSQAAARLGVKTATLYAYVARGLIGSVRAETGGSTFDALDVEALASAHRRSGRTPSASRLADAAGSGRPLAVVDSPLTLLADDRLYYRGVDAVELSDQLSFEQAVEFFWDSGAQGDYGSDPGLRRAAGSAGELLGIAARPIDRLGLAVILAGSRDPLRDELSTPIVHAAGRTMIGAMVDALPELWRAPSAEDFSAEGASVDDPAPLARRIWPKLSPLEPSEAEVALLDAALVLCLDHDLAAATLAARVAASARAHPYAAVQAALGAFDSALHGSMSTVAADMIAHALDSGHPERALAEQVGAGRAIPGFGHVIYRRRDPRAEALFGRMRAVPRFHEVLRTADRLDAIVASRTPRPANLDLALAAIAVGARMPRGSGQLIFAIARTAGWIAHIVDEYAQAPLRLRPESHYTGIAPAAALLPWDADRVRLKP
jgi:citrate synthase